MRKISHSNAKLIVNDLDSDKAFKSMHQSIMTKPKKSVNKDWIIKTVVELGIKIFEC